MRSRLALDATGTVTRHGRGWRGYWREDGKRKATSTYERKGEAREALNREFDRIKLGASYRAPITLREPGRRIRIARDRALPPARPAPPLRQRPDRASVPVTTVAAQLGHSKNNLTLDVYSHVLVYDEYRC